MNYIVSAIRFEIVPVTDGSTNHSKRIASYFASESEAHVGLRYLI